MEKWDGSEIKHHDLKGGIGPFFNVSQCFNIIKTIKGKYQIIAGVNFFITKMNTYQVNYRCMIYCL